MSPTTLYREGTDLDELLAELDEQYPGQVQVLEITHPREGGVLGFFAKQRVGVHYRLADALPETDPFMTALAAARGRAETMAGAAPAGTLASGMGAGSSGTSMTGRGSRTAGGGLDVLGDADVPAGVAAAAALIAEEVAAESRERSAAQAVADEAVVTARAARPAAGLGPDPETLAAALTGRAVPPADGAAGTDPFASLLASLAVKRPAANLRVPAQTSRGAAADDVPGAVSGRAARAAALYDQRPAAPDGTPAAARGLERGIALGYDEPGTATGQHTAAAAPAPGGYAPADLTATDFAAAGFDILSVPEADTDGQDAVRQDSGEALPAGLDAGIPPRPAITLNRGARRTAAATALAEPAAATVTALAEPAAATVTALAEPAAATALAEPAAWQPTERISTRPGLSAAEPSAAPNVAAPTGTAAASTAPQQDEQAGSPADDGATGTAATTQRRTAPLAWPIAQSANKPGGAAPQLTLRRGAAGQVPTGATAADAAPSGAASSESRGGTMVLTRQARAQAEPAPTSSPVAETATVPTTGTQRATSLTLRRQLLEVGVPVDRVPGDAVHTYAAIEQLVQALPPAPAAPSRPGEILVVVGAARDVVGAADGLLTATQTPFESIWTFGCPAASGTRRIPANGQTVLADVEQARTVAAEARAERTGPLLVVIATDTTTGREQAADVIAAISPDAVWAAVDATRKPADARRALAPAGRLDGMIVTHAERSSSPATVWELDLPIALVDGRASTGPVWAVLLLDKLGELAREEDAACSGARC